MPKKNGKPTLLEEFKAFINKGNAMALAVGTIIGGAFSGITKSVTNDLIMPLVNIFLGGADFSELKIELPRIVPVYETVVNEVTGLEEKVYVPHYLTYGNFISAVINFAILALEREEAEAAAAAKAAAEAEAAAKAAEEAANAPHVPTTEELLTQIRDLLAKQ